MKNIFYLSFKKLKEDLPRSVVLICCIVLLSIMIMIFGNICQYIQINFEDILLRQANEYGLDINIIALKDKNLDNKDLETTIKDIEQLNENFSYSSDSCYDNIVINGRKCDVHAYFSYGMIEEFKIVKGEKLSVDADGKNYIWLSQDFKDYTIEDILTLNINGTDKSFVVKGIVEGSLSYIDFRYTKIQSLKCIDMTQYKDFSVVKNLNKLYHSLEKYYGISSFSSNNNYLIQSSIISSYDSANTFYSVSVAVCVFLIVVTIALTILGLINSVKINTDKNQQFFAILRSIGFKEKDVLLYNMFLWIFYILLGVTIATIISAVVLHFSLGHILSTFFELINWVGLSYVTGFCWWIPFICIAVMFAICMIVAKKESNRLYKKEIAEMLKGDA